MKIDRRECLVGSLSGLALAACSAGPKAPAKSEPEKKVETPPAKKSILILGGTGFIGPHIVNAAIERSHSRLSNAGMPDSIFPFSTSWLVADFAVITTSSPTFK